MQHWCQKWDVQLDMAENFAENFEKMLTKLNLLCGNLEKQNAAIAQLSEEQQRQAEELRTLSASTFAKKVFECSTPNKSTPNDTVIGGGKPVADKEEADASHPEESHPQSSAANTCALFPPPFDSSLTRWCDYKIQFNIVAEANGWTSRQKAQTLATLLRGESVAVLSNLDPADRVDYDKLAAALHLRFVSQEKHVFHATFRSRRQRPNEDLGAFASEIRRLTRIVFGDCPSDAQERIAIMQFVDGIYDRSIQEHVRLTDPKTVAEAVTAATTIEAARLATVQSVHQARSIEVTREEVVSTKRHNNQPRRSRHVEAVALGSSGNDQQSVVRGQH